MSNYEERSDESRGTYVLQVRNDQLPKKIIKAFISFINKKYGKNKRQSGWYLNKNNSLKEFNGH